MKITIDDLYMILILSLFAGMMMALIIGLERC
jgi:hypothetical protein